MAIRSAQLRIVRYTRHGPCKADEQRPDTDSAPCSGALRKLSKKGCLPQPKARRLRCGAEPTTPGPPWAAVLDPAAVIPAPLIGAGVGLFPSVRAARIVPQEALRR
jgi:hypothetical protein